MTIRQEISEEYIEKILSDNSKDNVSYIQYPLDFKYLKFDLRARLFQVVTTLMKQYSVNRILMQEPKLDNDDLYKNIEYICSIARAKEFQSKNGADNLIFEYVKLLKEYLQTMNSFEQLGRPGGNVKGGGIQILNFDWRDSFCFWDTVYNIKRELLSEETFVSQYTGLIQKATQFKYAKNEIKDVVKIIYELYKNTYQHAYLPNLSDLSMRGFYAKKISINTQNDEIGQYQDYIDSIQKNRNAKTQILYFLELSVFDSGYGYFFSVTKEIPDANTDKEYEKEITFKCFEKHFSSKTTGIHGEGLSSVVNLLVKLKGLMVLRTGRVKVVFNGAEMSSFDEANVGYFEYIQGTSLSIMIPEIPSGEA